MSRNNRKEPTESEKKFWKIISYKKLNYKFTRQKPIGKCILDFYCSKLLLDIEIDGGSHNYKKYGDKARDIYLIQRGIKTIRYISEQVINNINKVKTDLLNQINIRLKEIS